MAKQSTTVATPSNEGKEVMVVNDQALMTELFGMKGDVGHMVNVRRELIKVPRIKLAQKSSAAFEARLANLGEFFCEVRQANYGPTVEIIPILINESASYLDKDTSQIICDTPDLIRSRDNKLCKECPYGQYWNDWGTKEQKKVPGCKHSINIVCLVANDPEMKPMEINFRKNNSKAGREIINLVVNDIRGIPFGTSYKLSAKEGTSGQYTFHYVNSKNIGKRALSNKEIMDILPTVKRIIELDKTGALEREVDGDDREPGDDLPI